MTALFNLTQRLAYPLLRVAMAVVLFWIGALKFVDPSPVVGLLGASFPFLAFPSFVYLLGVGEVVLALALLADFKVKWTGLLTMGLFVGTLAILLIAPKVVYGDGGFPLLSLVGEFLLKDLVLFAASLSLSATAAAREGARPVPASITERRLAA